jgi:hypothetical protein
VSNQLSLLVASYNRHGLLRTTLESLYKAFENSEAPKLDWLNDFVWKQRGPSMAI